MQPEILNTKAKVDTGLKKPQNYPRKNENEERSLSSERLFIPYPKRDNLRGEQSPNRYTNLKFDENENDISSKQIIQAKGKILKKVIEVKYDKDGYLEEPKKEEVLRLQEIKSVGHLFESDWIKYFNKKVDVKNYNEQGLQGWEFESNLRRVNFDDSNEE